MNEWLNLLRESLASESADRPAVMTLATLSRNGSPRARCVVCRAIDDDGSIWFVSDARSKKNQQIKLDRRVEAVFWLANLKRQFRIRGEARVIGAPEPRAIELWKHLPDSTRAMFAWPAPGEPRQSSDDSFRTSLSVDVSPPATFEAIAIHPSLVETLDLNEHPHRRLRFRRKHGWGAEQINP
jgi:pyridoxamine 5'-phosphate oxidase